MRHLPSQLCNIFLGWVRLNKVLDALFCPSVDNLNPHHQGLNYPKGRIVRGLGRHRHGFEVSIFAPIKNPLFVRAWLICCRHIAKL